MAGKSGIQSDIDGQREREGERERRRKPANRAETSRLCPLASLAPISMMGPRRSSLRTGHLLSECSAPMYKYIELGLYKVMYESVSR